MIFRDGVPMRTVAGEEFVKEVEILRREGKQAKPLTEQNPLIQISTS